MSTLKDKELLNSIRILKDNKNKLNFISKLKIIQRDVELIENTPKIHSLIQSIECIISSLNQSYELVEKALPNVQKNKKQ